MPNYVKTGNFTNGGAPGLSASFFNNIERVFVQPSGGTETGTYWVEQGSNSSGWNIGVYIPTLSRGTTVVSVAIDTAILGATGVGAPSVPYSGSSGFYVMAASTGPSGTTRVGGNWTVQY